MANRAAKINWYSEDKKLCGRKPNQPNFNLPKQLFNKTLFIPLLAALLQNFWLRFETTILFKMVEKSNNYAIVDDITPQSTWESSLKKPEGIKVKIFINKVIEGRTGFLAPKLPQACMKKDYFLQNISSKSFM